MTTIIITALACGLLGLTFLCQWIVMPETEKKRDEFFAIAIAWLSIGAVMGLIALAL